MFVDKRGRKFIYIKSEEGRTRFNDLAGGAQSSQSIPLRQNDETKQKNLHHWSFSDLAINRLPVVRRMQSWRWRRRRRWQALQGRVRNQQCFRLLDYRAQGNRES